MAGMGKVSRQSPRQIPDLGGGDGCGRPATSGLQGHEPDKHPTLVQDADGKPVRRAAFTGADG
eukprot:3973506-Pyramimonas_sp.AAC.1